jgi:hypothetical protein
VIFIVEAYIFTLVQKYLRGQERRERLPISSQDVHTSTNTAREDASEARQRVGPSDSAVQEPYGPATRPHWKLQVMECTVGSK